MSFPSARYATDVNFQQSNKALATHQEAKVMLSGKYKLYGYKNEITVLPDGFALDCSFHPPGSKAEIDILMSFWTPVGSP